ncbi:immunoglobulin superfamily member 1-like [Notamacropus eugenii]|uniref:immunoglobulin superfamily member 1-like n=1 Tax=Notamacropus eugenii TaxID=9315 RepID=UPI003B67A8B5
MHVTLKCRQPPQTTLGSVTFTLLKLETPQALRSQSPAGTSAEFSLLFVTAQDAGNYSCVYHWKTTPYQVSESSEVLEIWVTDVLPKPSLSAWPQMVSGAKVTLLCRGPSWSRTFVLYKDRDEKNLPTMDNTQDGAKFILSHVTPGDSGNYSCSYPIKTNGSLWTQHSDPLQLIVIGSEPSYTLIITLSCVSFLLLLLCLLLLTIRCQGSITMGSFQGENLKRCLCCQCLSRSTCQLHQPEAPRVEMMYTEAVKERPSEPPIPMTEDPQGVTYAQLNTTVLNKKKYKPMEKATEPVLYFPVLGD